MKVDDEFRTNVTFAMFAMFVNNVLESEKRDTEREQERERRFTWGILCDLMVSSCKIKFETIIANNSVIESWMCHNNGLSHEYHLSVFLSSTIIVCFENKQSLNNIKV